MELFKSKTKCEYAIYGTGIIKTGENGFPGDKVVYLVDLVSNGPGISNNVDGIAEEISRSYPNYRIAYRDTHGSWGEIVLLDKKFYRFGGWYPNWHPDKTEVDEKVKIIVDALRR